jgi:hypothetical protein
MMEKTASPNRIQISIIAHKACRNAVEDALGADIDDRDTILAAGSCQNPADRRQSAPR